MTGEVIGPRVEAAIVIFQTGHVVTLHSKCPCLYPQFWAASNLGNFYSGQQLVQSHPTGRSAKDM